MNQKYAKIVEKYLLELQSCGSKVVIVIGKKEEDVREVVAIL
jgi:hypothetical protein